MIPTRPLTEHKSCAELAAAFRKTFARDPKFVAMAPGRVNLIGEHIDYCGYPVLPIALDRSVRIACDFEVGKDGLDLRNCSERFPAFHSDTLEATIDPKQPAWHMYFLCGYRAIVDYAKSKGETLPKIALTLLVDGDIPPNAGLSSSSALVVAGALTVAKAAGFQISKLEMAQLCARAERYIGTEGGGMDQAISLMAEAGKALLVDFGPPMTTQARQLPNEVRFVVANSLVEVNKAAGNEFNQRVAECRLAAKLLTRRHSKDTTWRNVKTLKEAQQSMGLKDPQSALDAVYATLIHEDQHHAGDGLENEFGDSGYEDRHGTWKRAEVLSVLDCTEEDLQTTVLNPRTTGMREFHVGPRARHVYSEAERTMHMAELCKALEEEGGDLPPEVKREDIVHEMGLLMNRSHKSLDQFYQCSHPEVNQLVEIALRCGSIGSRLTGAGWGGCTIHMVPERKVEAFVEALRIEYFEHKDPEAAKSAVFVVQPGSCAAIFQ